MLGQLVQVQGLFERLLLGSGGDLGVGIIAGQQEQQRADVGAQPGLLVGGQAADDRQVVPGLIVKHLVARQRLQSDGTAFGALSAIGDTAIQHQLGCLPVVSEQGTSLDGLVMGQFVLAPGHGIVRVLLNGGAQRLYGVGHLVLGSETQHVLTHSAIPVLVLR